MTPEPLAFIDTADLAGLLRGMPIPLAELPKRMCDGIGIAPSNLMLSVFGPIPSPGGPDIHLPLGGFHGTDGAPWECCPRGFLRRALAALVTEIERLTAAR